MFTRKSDIKKHQSRQTCAVPAATAANTTLTMTTATATSSWSTSSNVQAAQVVPADVKKVEDNANNSGSAGSTAATTDCANAQPTGLVADHNDNFEDVAFSKMMKMSKLALQEFFHKRHELLEKIVLVNANQVQTILQDHGLFVKVKDEPPDEDVTEIFKLASDETNLPSSIWLMKEHGDKDKDNNQAITDDNEEVISDESKEETVSEILKLASDESDLQSFVCLMKEHSDKDIDQDLSKDNDQAITDDNDEDMSDASKEETAKECLVKMKRMDLSSSKQTFSIT